MARIPETVSYSIRYTATYSFHIDKLGSYRQPGLLFRQWISGFLSLKTAYWPLLSLVVWYVAPWLHL